LAFKKSEEEYEKYQLAQKSIEIEQSLNELERDINKIIKQKNE